MDADDLEGMLTVEETAALYRVSTKTIRRWIQRGWLQAIRQDRTVRIMLADLAEAMQRQRVDPWTPPASLEDTR
jgi:excisionase family DNA binding protein